MSEDEELCRRLLAAADLADTEYTQDAARSLRKAADAIDALVKERDALREALSRQADNMAFVLNHATLTDFWYNKLSRELHKDRAALTAALSPSSAAKEIADD